MVRVRVGLGTWNIASWLRRGELNCFILSEAADERKNI